MTERAKSTAFRKILEIGAVPPDAVLVVHSAISKLSHRGFRAERIIDAMLDHLQSGTLIMPTMTWRTVNPENPMFDELNTASHSGVLTEVFRTQYASTRSLHPTHSVAGIGPAAKLLLSTHQIGETPVPGTSPYGLMRDHDAYILMIGIGLECCTAIHHLEEVFAPDVYVSPRSCAELYTLRSRNGATYIYSLRRHRKLQRDFPKFEPRLLKRNAMSFGNIESVSWKLVKVTELFREVSSALIENPYETLLKSEPLNEVELGLAHK